MLHQYTYTVKLSPVFEMVAESISGIKLVVKNGQFTIVFDSFPLSIYYSGIYPLIIYGF
jgi:hypothetical protein